jgi:hypothetical protein
MQVEIPGTLGFMADDTGKIYGPDGVERNYYRNGDGYVGVSVKTADKNWQTMGVHRLVAMAFYGIPADLENMTVNHIDGNVENNSVENLEWSTAEENNIHAAILNWSGGIPSIIGKHASGEERYFNGLREASQELGKSLGEIWSAIKAGTVIENWALSHNGKNAKIPETLRRKNYSGIGRNSQISHRAIKSLNVESKEVVFFRSLLEMAKHHSVSASHIFQCLSVPGNVKLFKRQYLIVDANCNFPYVSDEELDCLKNPTGRNVLAWSCSEKKLYIYESASEFIRERGLSKKAVTTSLKAERIREVNGWLFVYLNDMNRQRLMQFLGFSRTPT